VQKNPIELLIDNQKVRGNLYVPDTNAKNVGVLFLHGWTGKPNESAAQFLAEHEYHALAIQMRGHGDSEGDIKKIRAQDSLNDAIAAYDYLVAQLPANGTIVAVGNSYGSYIAVLLSEARQLKGLSLRVPAAYPDESFELPKWGRGHDDPVIDAWRKQAHHYSTNNALSLLHEFEGNIQIIEAEKDEIVPRQTVYNYKNAVANPSQLSYIVLKNWPHSMGIDPKRNREFQELLLNWLNRL
jgi:uncharacterized protein